MTTEDKTNVAKAAPANTAKPASNNPDAKVNPTVYAPGKVEAKKETTTSTPEQKK